MQLDLTQRWNAGRIRWVADRAVIDPDRYRVGEIQGRDAGAFCAQWHYAGAALGATRLCVGLFEQLGRGAEDLVGICVFGMLMQPAAAARWCDQGAREVPELQRLALADRVPFNAESHFVARAIKLLRQRIGEARALISYADPVPRRDARGHLVKRGHLGVCYQALSMRYVGTSKPRTLILDARGRVMSERSLSKLRNGERGAAYAERQLVDAGAPLRRRDEDPRDYAARALREGPFRQFKHAGNLVYTMSLRGHDRDTLARLAPALPYLRKADLGLA